MKKLSLLFFLSLPLFSQCTSTGTYTLASTGQVITVTQPPPQQKHSSYHSTVTITFSTTVNIPIQLEIQQNSTGVTGTQQPVIAIAPTGSTCENQVFYSSAVPVGNIIGQYIIGAGSGQITIDTSAMVWNPSQNTQSLTLRIGSTTATISVNWTWTER